ncbi:c-type cytochrome [Chelativorans intermedius]|uniref:C-type cytochrome n=1 Tax=Chelativorans intermedius TaxID=515947 RepID=A0ABV6DBC1_9HYPH|nr:cytochrome c [Chelativorans intermedius]MCT9000277.1 cytochrome c [Chelativorans intermedius]
MSLLLTIVTANAAAEATPALDPEEVENGRAIYEQYCASCHGAKAEGAPGWREQNELGELPAPPHDPEGHTWRHSDADLYAMISKGWRDPFNKTDRLTMPPFGDILTHEEIKDVIAYLKSLWTEEQRQYQREESLEEPFPAETTKSSMEKEHQ